MGKRTVLPLALLALASLDGTRGAIVGWTGEKSTDWTVKENWNTSSVPTSADDVYIASSKLCILGSGSGEFGTMLITKEGSLSLSGVSLAGMGLTVGSGGKLVMIKGNKPNIRKLVVKIGGSLQMQDSTINQDVPQTVHSSWTVQKGADLSFRAGEPIEFYGNFSLVVDSGANIKTQSPTKFKLNKANINDKWSPSPRLRFHAPIELGQTSRITSTGNDTCIYKPNAPATNWADVVFSNLTISGIVAPEQTVAFGVAVYAENLYVKSKLTVLFKHCNYIHIARLEKDAMFKNIITGGGTTNIEQLYGPGELRIETSSNVQILNYANVGIITHMSGKLINKGQIRVDKYTLATACTIVDKGHGAVFNITSLDIQGATVNFKGGEFNIMNLLVGSTTTILEGTDFRVAKTFKVPHNQSKTFQLCNSHIWLRKGSLSAIDSPVTLQGFDQCNSTMRVDGYVNVSSSLILLGKKLDVFGEGHFGLKPAATLIARFVGFALGGVVIQAKSIFRCDQCRPKLAQVLAHRWDQDYPTWPSSPSSLDDGSGQLWRPRALDPSAATLAVLFVMGHVRFHCGAVCDKLDYTHVNGTVGAAFNMSVVNVSGTITPLPYPPTAFDPQPAPPPTPPPLPPNPPVVSPQNSCPPPTPPANHSAFPLAVILVGAGALLVGMAIGAIIMKRISSPKPIASSPRRRQAGSRGRGNEQEAMLAG